MTLSNAAVEALTLDGALMGSAAPEDIQRRLTECLNANATDIGGDNSEPGSYATKACAPGVVSP